MVRRWGPLLVVVVLLATTAFAASTARVILSKVDAGTAQEQVEQVPTADPSREVGSTKPERARFDVQIPSWVVLALIVAGIVTVAAIVLMVARMALSAAPRFRRRSLPRRPLPTARESTEAEVAAAVEESLRELDESDSDPRAAVIACWVRLERAADAAGTRRLPGDTSTELVLRMLAAHNLSGDVLSGFADVYRIARYAPKHEIDEMMRQQTRAALMSLRAELSGVAA